MSGRSHVRGSYVMFLRDLDGLLSSKNPKQMRERMLKLVEGSLLIIEHLAPKPSSPKARARLIDDIRDVLDRSPCEEYQLLLRASLHRLQGHAA